MLPQKRGHAQGTKPWVMPGLSCPVPSPLRCPTADGRMSSRGRILCSPGSLRKRRTHQEGNGGAEGPCPPLSAGARVRPRVSLSNPRHAPTSRGGACCTGVCKDEDAGSRDCGCPSRQCSSPASIALQKGCSSADSDRLCSLNSHYHSPRSLTFIPQIKCQRCLARDQTR